MGHLDDDRWRVVAGGGYVLFNSDYYGVGNSLGALDLTIPIEQRATLGLGQLMRRLRPGLYAGLRILAATTTLTVRGPEIPPLHSPEVSVNAEMYAASPVLQWDTRDNTFAPGKGFLVNVRVDIFSGSFHYRSTSLAVNHSRSLGGRSVLVMRAYLQTIDGGAPFFALCSFGQGSDLRGYTSGRYRDLAMAAGQGAGRSLGQGNPVQHSGSRLDFQPAARAVSRHGGSG